MVKNKIIIVFVFIFLAYAALCASQNELRWGGRGYDPSFKKDASSRFVARPNCCDLKLIDIWVDSKKTVNEVGKMHLLPKTGLGVSSTQCWKAMRHEQAPWACSFNKDELRDLKGEGKIQIMDRSNRMILEDDIDYESLKDYITTLNPVGDA